MGTRAHAVVFDFLEKLGVSERISEVWGASGGAIAIAQRDAAQVGRGRGERAGEVQLLLFDALGNRIGSPRFEVPAGPWQYKLQTGQLPAGVYWLHVRTEEGGKVLRWVRG